MAAERLSVSRDGGHGTLELERVRGARETVLIFAGEDVPSESLEGWCTALRGNGRATAHVDLATFQPEVHALPVQERELALDDRRAMADAGEVHAVLRGAVEPGMLLAVLGIGAQGTQAFLHACGTRDLYAACLLSARLVYHDLTPRKNLSPIDFTMNLACPLLGLFTTDDGRLSAQDREAFRFELNRTFRPHEFHEADGEGGIAFATNPNVEKLLAFLDEWADEALGEDD